MTTTKPKKGDLLIAEPSIIGDVSFNRSIVLLTDYNAEGAIGFILNKPLNYTISDLIPELDASFKVYNGGPVEQDNLYFIHKIPDLIPGSIEISQGIYWGGDFKAITKLLADDKLTQSQIRFFLGYSGWSTSQLTQELKLNSWVITPNEHKNNIIGNTNNNLWKEKMLELGGSYKLWSNAPQNPSYN